MVALGRAASRARREEEPSPKERSGDDEPRRAATQLGPANSPTRGCGHGLMMLGTTLKRVHLGRSAIVGLNAVALPEADIGDRAVVGAGVFVPKDTKVPPGRVSLGPTQAEALSPNG